MSYRKNKLQKERERKREIKLALNDSTVTDYILGGGKEFHSVIVLTT